MFRLLFLFAIAYVQSVSVQQFMYGTGSWNAGSPGNNQAEKHRSEPSEAARLAMAQKDTVIAPYTALQISGDTSIALPGRKVLINKDGFPKQIQTFFNPEMTSLQASPNNLLYEPIHFHLTRQSNSKDIVLKPGLVSFTERSAGTVSWKCTNTSDSLEMQVQASLEFDGFMKYTVKLTAREDINFKDIVMHIPFQKDQTKYLMSPGEKAGIRPEKVTWKWDVTTKDQDGIWIGNVNAGLQYTLRDEEYGFPQKKPVPQPRSWGNSGKGGIEVGIKGASMLANNFSGDRILKKGDTLYYNFTLFITPFHTLNTKSQWSNQFYHKYADIDSMIRTLR